MKHKTIFLIAVSLLFFILGNQFVGLVQGPWFSYGIIFSISILIFMLGGTQLLFTLPVFFYIWFTFLNLAAVLFLHLGQYEGANYFIIKIFPDPWHYQILIKEQIYFSAATLLAIPLLIKTQKNIKIQNSKFDNLGLSQTQYRIAKNYWWIIYAIGAIAALILISGGGDAALNRRARVGGAGVFVVLQYLALIGFAMYIVSRPKRPIIYDFVIALFFSIPLVLTQERSFFIIMWLTLIAYHVLYTQRLNLRQISYLAVICGLAIVSLGVWRASGMGDAGTKESNHLSSIEKDLSMNLGYLLYREQVSSSASYDLKPLALGFGFFSRGIIFFLGEIPSSPNNNFTDMVFPQINLSSTFSMGYLGEAYYMLNKDRWLYYLVTVFLLLWLEKSIVKNNTILKIIFIGLVFRVAKGGVIAGISTMLPTIILLYLVYFFGALALPKNKIS